MRKRCLLILLLLMTMLTLPALSISIGYDVLSFDFFWNKDINARGVFSVKLNDEVRLSLSLSYADTSKIDNQIKAFDAALHVAYYLPRLHGLYASVSLVNAVFLFGLDAPTQNPLFITSISLGYELSMIPYCSLDLAITAYDAFKTSEGDYLKLLSSMRHYSRFKLSLIASVRFDFKEDK